MNLKKIKTKFKLFTYVTDWKGYLPLSKKQLSVRKTSKYLENTLRSTYVKEWSISLNDLNFKKVKLIIYRQISFK